MKHFILLLIILVMAPIKTQAEAPLVWKIQSYKNEKSLMHKSFIKYVVEPVNKELQGKFEIQFPPQSQKQRIASNKGAFSAIHHDLLQGVLIPPVYWGHIDPVFAIVGDLTAAWASPQEFMQWFDIDGGKQMVQKSYAKHGLVHLSYTLRPHESLVSTAPLRSIDDIYGKLMRVPGSGLAIDYFKKLGAIPRTVSIATAPRALKEQRIEMADFSTIGSNYDEGLYDTAKHTNYPGFHSLPLASVIVSQKKWRELPYQYKNVLNKHLENWKMKTLQDMTDLNHKVIPILEKNGVNIYKWDEKELLRARRIAVTIWDEHAQKSDAAKEVIEAIKTWLKSKNHL